MAKNNKKNKSLMPLFVLVILPLLAISISSFAIYQGIQHYLTDLSYFKVRQLNIEGIRDERYCDLMNEEILGVNIFKVNTVKLAEHIRRRFPTFYNVAVTRVLPSQLSIVAKERIPVGVIKRDLYYVFDAEGVALSGLPSIDLFDFPLIVGLENKLPTIKVGAQYSALLLHKTLLLAKALRALSPAMRESLPKGVGLKITKIDATDPGNLCFYLGDGIQIKVGDREFEKHLSLLPAILRSIGADLANVTYIDLRPKEPVVATKNNKKS